MLLMLLWLLRAVLALLPLLLLDFSFQFDVSRPAGFFLSCFFCVCLRVLLAGSQRDPEHR